MKSIQWDFQPIFESYWPTLVLAIIAGAGLYFVRIDSKIPFWRRWTLTGLRILLVVWLILLGLRPGVSWTSRQASDQAVAVLVDTSGSMELPSGSEKLSRWEIEQRVLEKLQAQAERLGPNVHWRIYGYDSQLRRLNPKEVSAENSTSSKVVWKDWLPANPPGLLTDVGKSLSQVLAEDEEPPLLALIWLGDGAQTARGDTSEAQQAARLSGQLDVPLYLIGVGPRSVAQESLDQIVDGVPDQIDDAFTKNRVPIRGNLRAIGLQNRELNVTVKIRQADGQFELLERTKLKANQNDQTLPFNVSILAPEPGAYQLLVEAVPVDGEATLMNNQQTCFLNVRDSGSRVLFLEGQPRLEQTFIRRALSSSPDLQIDWRFFRETDRKQWPFDLKQILDEDLFDCIVLGDLDSSAIRKDSWERVVQLVQQGVGLVTLGGYHAYAGGNYQATPLGEILPVELDSNAKQYFDSPINDRGHLTGEIPIVPRRPHPILALGNSELTGRSETESTTTETKSDNASSQADQSLKEAWQQLRPLLGANRWKDVRSSPGVQILATSPKNDPLIVTGEAGRGRVLALAFDTSYRWWGQGKSDWHRQFWRQAVLWTMRREEANEGLRLSMPRRSFSLGESSSYTLTWNPGSKQTLMPAKINLRWRLDDVDRGPLLPNQSQPLVREGQLGPFDKPGRYEIVASTHRSDGSLIEERLPFIVMDLAIEKIQATPDWPLMYQLAKLNENAGGKVIAPESTDEIMKFLRDRRRDEQVDTVQTYRLGQTFVDSWATFLAIVFLLTLQWSLRKAWNMP
jgi:uncharacterized membrane protein